jgi:hypothetical protein
MQQRCAPKASASGSRHEAQLGVLWMQRSGHNHVAWPFISLATFQMNQTTAQITPTHRQMKTLGHLTQA